MADLQEAIRTALPPDEDPTTTRQVDPQDKRVCVDSLRLELAAAVAAVADACEEMLKPLETTRDFQVDMDDLLSLDEYDGAVISQSIEYGEMDSAVGGVNGLIDLDEDKWNELKHEERTSVSLANRMEATRCSDDDLRSETETLKEDFDRTKNEDMVYLSHHIADQGGELGTIASASDLHEVTKHGDKDPASGGGKDRIAPTHLLNEMRESIGSGNGYVSEKQLTEEMQGYSSLGSDVRSASSASAPVSSVDNKDNVWMSYMTENGVPYYYNSETQVSQWTRPETQSRSYPCDAIFDAAAGREPFASEISSILQSGIDVDDYNSSGLTPLHIACQEGNFQGVMELIRHGANVDTQSNSTLSYGETPLWEACRISHLKIIKLLLSAGCHQDVTDLKSNTVTHLAVQLKNDRLLSFLLENFNALSLNAFNSNGETPLHLAAKNGFAEGVQLLLEHGAAKEVEDGQGRTALVLSIMENHFRCVQLLQNSDQSKVIESDHATASTITHLGTKFDGVSGDMTMEDLQLYLFELLEKSDSQLYSAFYQFANGVHSHFTDMEQELKDTKRKNEMHEENTKDMATTISDLNQKLNMAHDAAEALVSEKMNQHLLEFEALESSCKTLHARCDVLDSVARGAQEKLHRERLEFAHYEQQLQEQIHNCLVENKRLFSSMEKLRAEWHQHLQQANYDTSDTQTLEEIYGANDGTKIHAALNPSLQTNPKDENYEYDASKVNPSAIDHFDDNSPHESFRELVTSSNQHDTEGVNESTSTVSPARVDAVWNRFFENLAKSVDYQNSSTTSKSFQRDHVRSQPLRNPVLSSHVQASLFDAIRKSHLNYLEKLLLDGLSPNMRDIGEKGTPLHLACELGDLESVLLLCEYTADLEMRDENGNTALLVSCSQGHYDCTKFLLQSAANLAVVNVNGDTSLHLAAWDGSYSCVEILVEYGIDIFSTNNFGLTALANLKTRSPLRHRFDDLDDEHPMRKTIMLLEECEDLDEDNDGDELAEQASFNDQANSDVKTNKATWKEWIFGLGRSKGQSEIRDPSVDGDKIDYAADSNDSEDENDVDSEEDESIDSSDSEEYQLEQSLSPLKYELVRPPPEIEAELRRAAARANQHIDSLASPLAVPISTNDTADKRTLLSPLQRIAASNTQKKKLPSSLSTAHVRARYVDTFNPTTI